MHKFEFININAKCSDFNFVDQYNFFIIYCAQGEREKDRETQKKQLTCAGDFSLRIKNE